MNGNNLVSVSVVIPCRNEESYIGKCLDSIIANDPKNKMEILVVDGMSEDGTRELVTRCSENYSFIKLVDNPSQKTTAALNLGIKESKGKYVTILSSHSKVGINFIDGNIDNLKKYAADCVGGVMQTIPANQTLSAQAIAFVLSDPFGVGNSHFRIGVRNPKVVDTVPFGCYKKQVFKQIGYFDENLIRNQDLEFNLRLRKAGGRILLVPGIVSYYYARPGLKDLFKQNFRNGFWIIYGLRFANLPFSTRHLIPFAFVFSLLSSFAASFIYFSLIYVFGFILGLYGIFNVLFSMRLALRKGLKYFPSLALGFATLHISYGLGSILGMIKTLAFHFGFVK